MSFTVEQENVLVGLITVDDHVSVDGGKIRPICTRDGLRIYVHRQLYKRLRGALGPHEYLLPDCDVESCVNPHHYTKSIRNWRTLTHCPNGHEYGPLDQLADGRYRCIQCEVMRRVRRARPGEPHWAREKRREFCPNAHRYTPDNTYEYPTKYGGVRRKCKACARARSAGLDPATVTAA